MLEVKIILKNYDENKPKYSTEGPQKFSIGGQTTMSYKIKREDIDKDMSDSFYDQLKRTGVYVLFGKTVTDNHDLIYIGQSDNVAKRLYDHKGGKDGEKQQGKVFWNECYAFVSIDSQLQKGNAEYLEYEFYQKAHKAGRYILDNTNIPTEKIVSEGDKIFCDDFVGDCDLLSRIMGRPLFEIPEKSITPPSDKMVIDNSARIGDDDLRYVNATGYKRPTEEYENGFTVLENSIIAKNVTKKASKSIRDMRKDLKKRGYIREENGKLVFKNEYTFPSPGIAASVVLGRGASAKEWKEVK